VSQYVERGDTGGKQKENGHDQSGESNEGLHPVGFAVLGNLGELFAG
jgi:hypothetical protein